MKKKEYEARLADAATHERWNEMAALQYQYQRPAPFMQMNNPSGSRTTHFIPAHPSNNLTPPQNSTAARVTPPAKLADILSEYHVCSTMLAPNGPHQEIEHESGSCEWTQELGLDVTALEILELILGHEREDHGKKVREHKPPQTDAILNLGLYGFTSWQDEITEHTILSHTACEQNLDVTARGKEEMTDSFPSFGTIGHLATICSLHKCDDGQWTYKEDYQ